MPFLLKLLFIITVFFSIQAEARDASLEDLQSEYDWYQSIVNDKNMWCVPEGFGGLPAHQRVVPTETVESVLSRFLGTSYAPESQVLYREVLIAVGIFSQTAKNVIRRDVLPPLETAIDNHPDNWSSSSPPSIEFENPVGYQCPEFNPGDQLRNKFNDSGNGSYLQCNYFNDGKLQYQAPYTNGELDGIMLLFNTPQPHHLADRKPYVNGELHGTMETWLVDAKSGHHWLLRKTSYTNGERHGETITYRNNGTMKSQAMHNYGQITSSCTYNKDGVMTYCKEY